MGIKIWRIKSEDRKYQLAILRTAEAKLKGP
jgi:hypothetical protein